MLASAISVGWWLEMATICLVLSLKICRANFATSNGTGYWKWLDGRQSLWSIDVWCIVVRFVRPILIQLARYEFPRSSEFFGFSQASCVRVIFGDALFVVGRWFYYPGRGTEQSRRRDGFLMIGTIVPSSSSKCLLLGRMDST